MITLITGNKNSGKSSYIENCYDSLPKGVGCITRKAFDGDTWVGYNLVLLPHRITLPFIRLKPWQNIFSEENRITYNRMTFSKKAFENAIGYLTSAPKNAPLWLDEIGNLELKDQGFSTLIRQALKQKRELHLTFRKNLFDALVKHYELQEWQRIDV